MRAEAAWRRGDADAALQLAGNNPSAQGTWLRMAALIDLGRVEEALSAATQYMDTATLSAIDDAAELTAASGILTMRARYEGRPAQDYHKAMRMLETAHTELDRLYWPAHIAEARLLMEKDNNPQAYEAIIDALQLNPRAAEGWYLLGLLAGSGFQFDRAEQCAQKLREINPQHLLADLLMAESYLAQKDADSARASLAPALHRFAAHRYVAALLVAVEALDYNDQTFEAALEHFDRLSPANPLAYVIAGRYLSLARQYDDGERILREAIALDPNWPEPRVELGLLLMQSGDEGAARKELAEAARLDPFNVRAGNQLKLAEELREYKQIRTEHFVIKYRNPIDEVLARDMPEELENIYRDITAIYEHRPGRPTLIEIMPDEHHFGVRITGMPEIWTIAACTGDVIALTPPRPGTKMRGEFDWARVIRHEFVHTVTLHQTANRIPHWFTEACAVAVEPGDRDYTSCQLLVVALHEDELFNLTEINWAFARPKRPQDRNLAYAQAHWMMQYIGERFGHAAIVKMLNRFHEGIDAEEAIEYVIGRTAKQFMDEFLAWAREQVSEWGLDVKSTEQAKVLRAAAEALIEANEHEKARVAVLQYAAVRPVDPWSRERIVELATQLGRDGEAIEAMEQLDRQAQSYGYWSNRLAQSYREANRLNEAADAAKRALQREPYNGTFREQAAAIALQRGDSDQALHHIRSLTLLEPARSIHFVRLAAMHHRLGRLDLARTAAVQARKLDPNAPVDRYIGEP